MGRTLHEEGRRSLTPGAGSSSTAPGQHGDYDLYTFGADNAQGGNGEDQDITSW